MPGRKIRAEDQLIIDAKFFCCVCSLLLVAPVQTMCGHLMCLSCLDDLFRKKNAACPVDGNTLKEGEYFRDAYTTRELNALTLRCLNPDCRWRGTYEEQEKHLSNCDHSLISCVRPQCTKKLKRALLGEHLKTECEYRLVNCDHCGEEIVLNLLKKHIEKDCVAVPLTCRHCGTEGILRKDLGEHENYLCDEMDVECDFKAVGCNHDKVLKRKFLRQHFNDSLIYHVQLLLQFVLGLGTKLLSFVSRVEFTEMVNNLRGEMKVIAAGVTEKIRSLPGKLAGIEQRMVMLEAASRNLGSRNLQLQENGIGELRIEVTSMERDFDNKMRSLERQLREKDGVIERLRIRIDQLDESLALNTVKLNDLEGAEVSHASTTPSHNGTLLWKIEQFQRKRQDALNGIKTAVYSPHFYSSQYGYKMCVKIYMNGDGFGKGTHISLFFVVMKGEYDALQVWPFQKKITMMLLDQQNGDHMVDAFHSDPQSSSFQRPKSDMNIASGSPLFMPLDGLNKRSYVKDDVMFIKIIVD